jgi:tRNA(Ile)-lysidine synthase TilS/MesJ
MLLFLSALGVSGGPDSMALCVLTAGWKTTGVNSVGTDSSGFIDGLLAIIIDHGLRAESKEEANVVRNRVSDMGWYKFVFSIRDCVVWICDLST